MIARAMRFYGLTDEHVLHMPIRRFFALYRQIPRLAAEEDFRRLVIQHTGEPKDYADQLHRQIEAPIYSRSADGTSGRQYGPPSRFVAAAVMESSEPGFVEQERARQQEAATRLKAERDAWKAQHQAQ